ncbi:MAG: hypothetical protein ACREP9_13370, partial [Candidatus Dormibacteraceae bacterium]
MSDQCVQIGLRDLLGGRSLDSFIERIWECDPHLAQGAVRNISSSILTQDQFEALLLGEPSGLSIVEMGAARPLNRNGAASTDLSSVYHAYSSGSTL